MQPTDQFLVEIETADGTIKRCQCICIGDETEAIRIARKNLLITEVRNQTATRIEKLSAIAEDLPLVFDGPVGVITHEQFVGLSSEFLKAADIEAATPITIGQSTPAIARLLAKRPTDRVFDIHTGAVFTIEELTPTIANMADDSVGEAEIFASRFADETEQFTESISSSSSIVEKPSEQPQVEQPAPVLSFLPLATAETVQEPAQEQAAEQQPTQAEQPAAEQAVEQPTEQPTQESQDNSAQL